METSRKTIKIKELIELGLHRLIISVLEDLDINELRDIQSVAVRERLFDKKSMLVCSPSGSGKTLIGELAAIHNCLNDHKKSLFLVPLKAIASEKIKYFIHTYSKLNFRVIMAAGDEDVRPNELKQADIMVMTYEKFDSYLRVRKENSWIKDISTIIIDEIHILGEGQRGARLESLIIRLYEYLPDAQKIFLSATIANPKDLYEWLMKLESNTKKTTIKLIQSDVRPIELQYSILETQNKTRKSIAIISSILKDDGQVLIFTNTRKTTENISEEILELAPEIFKDFNQNYQNDLYIRSLLEHIRSDSQLLMKLKRGIGYHHAGLSSEERSLVEYMFLKGLIKIIVCTNTLSAGINTPARAVIIYDYKLYEIIKDNTNNKPTVKYNKVPIDRNTFHQIAGRAGRPGYDRKGTAYILTESKEESYWVGEHYFLSCIGNLFPKYDDVKSAFIYNNALFYELMLLKIYEGEKVEYDHLLDFARKSYFWHLIGSNALSIESYLNLDIAPFMVLLKLNTQPETIVEIHQSNIEWEISSFTIEAFISTVKDEKQGDIYKIKVVSNKGISCSCGRELIFQSESDFRKQEFCTHIAGLINGLNNEYDSEYPKSFHAFDAYFQEIFLNGNGTSRDKKQTPTNHYQTAEELLINSSQDQSSIFNIYLHINKILHRALYRTPLLDYLLNNEFITMSSKKESDLGHSSLIINCTDFGRVTIKCYISPATGQYLQEILKKNPPKSINEIFGLLLELPSKEDRKTHEDLSEILNFWINEQSIHEIQSDLLQKTGKIIYSSDIQSIIDDSSRIIRYIKELSTVLKMEQLASLCESLYFRVKIGIKEDLVPLGKALKEFDSNTIRTIFNAGYRKPEDLIKVMRKELCAKTGLSLELCNSILDAIDYFAQNEGLIKNILKSRYKTQIP